MERLLEQLRVLKPELVCRYQVESLAVFGSYVRHEEMPGSDLDILVTFTVVPGLFKYIELENLLSDELGIKVDLVMKDALKPGIGQRILTEAIAV